jgi:hypothetical protein
MTGSAKRKSLLILGLVMIIVMTIAASLPRLDLQPGMPVPQLEEGQVVAMPAESEPILAMPVNKFLVYLLTLLLVGSILYMLVKLARGADWKSIASFIRSMVVISLVISFALFLIMLLPKSPKMDSMPLPLPTPAPQVTSPLGPVPPVLLWLVGLGLLAASILFGIWILTTSRQKTTLELVGFEAEKAWRSLKTGMDLKEVIIQCYRQMSLAMEQDQKITRRNFMTAGEFEKLLEGSGIPHEPVHQLTRLFEAVRYGNWQPNPVDEKLAIQSLEAIIEFSREARETN